LLYFRSDKNNGDALVEKFRERNILLNHLGEGWLRVVTHLQVSADQMDYAIDEICRLIRK